MVVRACRLLITGGRPVTIIKSTTYVFNNATKHAVRMDWSQSLIFSLESSI